MTPYSATHEFNQFGSVKLISPGAVRHFHWRLWWSTFRSIPQDKSHWIWMFPKIVVPPKSSMLIRCFIINHPFWGSPIFGKHPYLESVSVSTLGHAEKSILFGPTLEHAQRSTEHHAWGTADCRLSCLWIVMHSWLLGADASSCNMKLSTDDRKMDITAARMFLFQQILKMRVWCPDAHTLTSDLWNLHTMLLYQQIWKLYNIELWFISSPVLIRHPGAALKLRLKGNLAGPRTHRAGSAPPWDHSATSLRVHRVHSRSAHA